MNLPLMIWQRLLRVATSAQHAAVVAELMALRAELASFKAATQTGEARINAKLDQILDQLTLPPAEAVEFDVILYSEDGGGIQSQTQGARKMTMTDSQRAQLTIRPVDRKNKPARLDGPPTWATSDPTVATVTTGILNQDGTIGTDPDDQGLNAVLEGVAPGSCRVTVSGDADLSTESASITGVLEVTVNPGQAINVVIDASSPVEVP
jgi:hypothetical protein